MTKLLIRILPLVALLLAAPAPLAADGYAPDILGPAYAQRTIALPPDGGAVPPVCTLVRHTPPTHARAALLYVHGYNDYFFQAALGDTATRRGYAFFAIDLRDYGRSIRPGRDPFYTDRVEDEKFGRVRLYRVGRIEGEGPAAYWMLLIGIDEDFGYTTYILSAYTEAAVDSLPDEALAAEVA